MVSLGGQAARGVQLGRGGLAGGVRCARLHVARYEYRSRVWGAASTVDAAQQTHAWLWLFRSTSSRIVGLAGPMRHCRNEPLCGASPRT